MEQPDVAWVAEYRRGNAEALGRLVEHYRRPLFGFILRMMEGHVDAEEVFQEVWFRAIKHIDQFREKNFLSWLFRIAHNLIIDRARRARPTVDIDGESGEGSRLFSPAVAPDRTVAGKDMGRRIAQAVKALPEEQREVFLMRTEGDIPFKEIAKIQGTSINTALARMQYALTKLRTELQGDYESLNR
jgi:RNA polymerase sigma-70 factor (ECF subfamily)